MLVNGRVIRVVVNGDHLLPNETQEYVEGVAFLREKLGLLDLLEIPIMLIVILHPVQQRLQPYPRDENRTKPVVNHTAGYRHFTAIGEPGVHLLDINPTAIGNASNP